jgi:GNAT superfamily N-acetyltransferase
MHTHRHLTADYQLVQLRTHDDHLLSELDTLHREFFQNSTVPPEQFTDFVSQRLADDQMLLVLAMSDDRAVGYGLAFDVSEHPFMPEWQRSGYITQLYVTPEHRGQGVGQRMVDFILTWMRSRDIQSVQLNTGVGETGAQEFWHKQGFVPRRVRMWREI